MTAIVALLWRNVHLWRLLWRYVWRRNFSLQYFYAMLKLPFSGIYMKIFYFFDISLIISRIDMKQTAKNV